jgi:hypothetical protein
MHLINDLFEPNFVIGPMQHFTDGKWIWPSYLKFYVEKYDLDLPVEFLKDIFAGSVENKRRESPDNFLVENFENYIESI